MSGKFENKSDVFVFLLNNNPFDNAAASFLAESIFEQNTNADEADIIHEIKINKILRKTCIVKFILYPFEWFFTRLIVGKDASILLEEQFSIYVKYFKGEIGLKELKGLLI